MRNFHLSLKLPAKILAGFLCLETAELILIGMPGPCSFSGMLEPLFRGKVELEFWLAYIVAGIAFVGALLSTVWCVSVFVVQRLPKTD